MTQPTVEPDPFVPAGPSTTPAPMTPEPFSQPESPTEQVPVWQTAQIPSEPPVSAAPGGQTLGSAPGAIPPPPAPAPSAPLTPTPDPFVTPQPPFPSASAPTYPPASAPPAASWGPAPTYTEGAGGLGQTMEHPMGTPVLIMGILGLVLFQLLGPVAWVMGNRALREIDAAPARYSNRGSVVAGRICGIIATVLLILAIFAFVLLLAGAFAAFRTTS